MPSYRTSRIVFFEILRKDMVSRIGVIQSIDIRLPLIRNKPSNSFISPSKRYEIVLFLTIFCIMMIAIMRVVNPIDRIPLSSREKRYSLSKPTFQ